MARSALTPSLGKRHLSPSLVGLVHTAAVCAGAGEAPVFMGVSFSSASTPVHEPVAVYTTYTPLVAN